MSGRALIIDKDTPFAERLAGALENSGYDVRTCGTGREGIDLAKVIEPELIVLCVELDDTSGYSICAKIKKDNRLKNVPLVITSEKATRETFDHHRKLKTRAQAYIMKPFEPSELLRHLRSSTLASESLSSSGMPPPLPPQTGEVELPEIGLEPIDVDHEIVSDASGSPGESMDPGVDPGLGMVTGLRDEIDEDDVHTTIGEVPAGVLEVPESTFSSSDEAHLSSSDLEAIRSRLFAVEQQRDDAIAKERAVQAQLEAFAASTSQLPASSGGASRELISVKKELNAKERELLELRETLQVRDRQLLDAKEREADLEERIVHVEEERSQADRARVEAEGRIAGAEARAEQIELSSKATIEGLQEELGALREQLEHTEQDLSGSRDTSQYLQKELDDARELIGRREDTLEQRESEITTLNAELKQALLEGDGLRGQLELSMQQAEALQGKLDTTEKNLQAEQRTLDILRGEKAQIEDRLGRNVQRLQDEADTRGKARQALEIGLNLLAEMDYAPEGGAMDGEADREDNLREPTHTSQDINGAV